MSTIKLNSKGQITLPRHIRKQLHLRGGDEIELMLQDESLIITRKEPDIEAAFGLCQAKVSVSLEQMEQAIRKRGTS